MLAFSIIFYMHHHREKITYIIHFLTPDITQRVVTSVRYSFVVYEGRECDSFQ